MSLDDCYSFADFRKLAKKNLSINLNIKIKFIKDRPGHDVRYALDSKKILKT